MSYGKPQSFKVLLPYYKLLPIDTPGLQGRTLLHISASAGQSIITRCLLELGANPSGKSKPGYTHMPEELYGGGWIPAEVPKAQSEERWLDTLADI